ncbi:glycerophosphodiester phosphodiesterase [Mycobacterium paraterrae]|uniref:Glycerophosphodiester phosphodiesterase n=2 Tax=Mycobacterium paraterrae TaxID=577492 RepID=A0ABY3VL92_9MYCO|nr:glycerophosphodiester phosphodiesterase family protein [Mycobacterium paraterrae]UMB70198.1 glycerophosphodiester phosphodiesterase [Mycobacterium paraterrae]
MPRAGAEAVDFDVIAHQGGPGDTRTGESLTAFANALETGVSTLELDIGITKDRQPVVWHDEFIDPAKCSDTAPTEAGDPQFPYVGKLVHELTLAQVRTLDCGNRIAVLAEVFALADQYSAHVRYDIETKVDAVNHSRTATPEDFIAVILSAVRAAGKVDRVEIESFDWRTLPLVHRAEPSMGLAALWDQQTWVPGSPWLAGVDPAAVGDPVAGAALVGATILSPDHKLVDRALVDRAHASGLKVLPWTVDNADDMTSLIDDNVDGIITNYPAVLRGILAERGRPLPAAYRR